MIDRLVYGLAWLVYWLAVAGFAWLAVEVML